MKKLLVILLVAVMATISARVPAYSEEAQGVSPQATEEIAALKTRLEEAKAESATKDAEIARLKKELAHLEAGKLSTRRGSPAG